MRILLADDHTLVRQGLRRILEEAPVRTELAVMPQPQHTISLGAALLAGPGLSARLRPNARNGPGSETPRRPPLKLVRSQYPAAAVHARWTDRHKNEMTVHPPPPAAGRSMDAWLGLDVGSTSTN